MTPARAISRSLSRTCTLACPVGVAHDFKPVKHRLAVPGEPDDIVAVDVCLHCGQARGFF